MRAYRADRPVPLVLGAVRFDLAQRALVMGILNRTPDSFYAPAATFSLDDLYRRADRLVAEGADLLDVGGVRAGPGDEVTETEELERVTPVVAELRRRFDVPLSVDTWRASVAAACFAVGASLGNDISGFADENYLTVAARAGASVVATHIRLRPRVADPTPHYDDVVATVRDYLVERWSWASAAGLGEGRVVLDAGLDLGKTPAHSLELLRSTDALARLGAPVLLSASNKTFLGAHLGLELENDARRDASNAAAAVGITLGARVVRAHDVAGTVRVRDTLARIVEAA